MGRTESEKKNIRKFEIASLELLAWFDEELINGNLDKKRYRFLTKQVDVLINGNKLSCWWKT